MADATLAKADDYVEFKRTVDKLLGQRFSLGFYINRIEKLLSPYANDAEKLRKISEKSILRNNPDLLKGYLDQQVDNKDIINTVLQVVQIAIGIAAL